MELPVFPFQLLNWDLVPPEEHKGTTGKSTWKVIQMGNIRVRLVEYSVGYRAAIGAVKAILSIAYGGKWIQN